jgi:two-component system CheB/CheR fusion protein
MCEVLRERVGLLGSDVRRLSHGLHPSLLDDLGLAAALRSLTSDFGEREGMITTFSAQDVPESLPIDIATGLYRIAQESLRNVGKHAGKTHVKVNLRGTPDGLQLQISDAGHGFEQRLERNGLGLISMEERARLMEANLRVNSVVGHGTSVTVLVPSQRMRERESV